MGEMPKQKSETMTKSEKEDVKVVLRDALIVLVDDFLIDRKQAIEEMKRILNAEEL